MKQGSKWEVIETADGAAEREGADDVGEKKAWEEDIEDNFGKGLSRAEQDVSLCHW